MSCEDYAELLSADLDGELSAAEQATLHAHLAGCGVCQALQQKLQGLKPAFASLPVAAPPPLRARPAAPRRRRWLFAPALLAAAAAVIFFLRSEATSVLYPGTGTLHRSPPGNGPVAVQVYRSDALTGQLSAAGTRFSLHLDSHEKPCKDVQLQLDYDFDGDGTVDRKEVYNKFSTDGKTGWEAYSQSHGLQSSSGEMQDFRNGRLTATLRGAPAHLQLLQGESRLVVPHKLT